MKRDMPTVSVIVPTRNRADLIAEALRSVRDKTYQDLEILVVDNGSTDKTPDVVAGLADPRILYHWQEDSGLPADSRNVGIRMSAGHYVAFLDSDDVWLPEKLERQVAYLETHPDCGLIFMNASIIGDHHRSGQTLLRKTPPSGRVFEALLWENFISTLTAMVPRRVLDKVGVFDLDPAIRRAEDYDLWLRIAHDYEVAYLPMVGGLYRFHGSNLFADPTDADLLYLRVIERAAARHGVSPRLVNRLASRHYARLAFKHMKQGRPEAFRAALRDGWRRYPSPLHVALRCAHALLGPRRLAALADRGRAAGLRPGGDHF